MNMSVSLKRELGFQGLVGFGSVCFALFFPVWFLDGCMNELLVILEWNLALF